MLHRRKSYLWVGAIGNETTSSHKHMQVSTKVMTQKQIWKYNCLRAHTHTHRLLVSQTVRQHHDIGVKGLGSLAARVRSVPSRRNRVWCIAWRGRSWRLQVANPRVVAARFVAGGREGCVCVQAVSHWLVVASTTYAYAQIHYILIHGLKLPRELQVPWAVL